jgi:hypothetical protein
MDPLKNPYAPGLSMPPPVLAGREGLLAAARLLLGRLKGGLSEKSLRLEGLRGSGRSSALQALAALARDEGADAPWVEARPETPFSAAVDAAFAKLTGPALLLVDDAHRLGPAELGLILRAQERFLLERRPWAWALAGLPLKTLLSPLDEAAAARLMDRHPLEPLDAAAAAQALTGAGVAWEQDALREALRLSKGHPMHLQAYAYQAWLQAAGPAITRADLAAGADAALARLDRDFYGPAFERLSPREKFYLRSMAHLGPGPMRSGDIADSMDAKITSLGPLRAKLMREDWIHSPEHGWLAFNSPGFDEYMRRVMPGFR